MGPRALVVLLPFIGIPLLIYRNWSKITGFLGTVFNAVVGFLKSVGGRVVAALAALFSVPARLFGAFRNLVGWFAGVWSSVTRGAAGFVRNIVGAVTGIPRAIAGLAGSMLGAGKHLIESLFKELLQAPGAIGGFAVSIGKAIVNSVIDGLNAILPHKIHIHIPIPVPGVDDININIPLIPTIPHLATGGIVPATPGGRIVKVAEAGQAEAIIPLSKLADLGPGGRAAPVVAGDLNVYGNDDPLSTARAVSRRLAFIGG